MPISGPGLTTVDHDFADDGDYVVTLAVSDDDGESVIGQLLVNVSNVAPTVSIQTASNAMEGDLVTLDLSDVTDPGTDSVIEWIVEWGDDQLEPYGVNDSISHSYPDGGATYTIVVHAVDEDGTHPCWNAYDRDRECDSGNHPRK